MSQPSSQMNEQTNERKKEILNKGKLERVTIGSGIRVVFGYEDERWEQDEEIIILNWKLLVIAFHYVIGKWIPLRRAWLLYLIKVIQANLSETERKIREREKESDWKGVRTRTWVCCQFIVLHARMAKSFSLRSNSQQNWFRYTNQIDSMKMRVWTWYKVTSHWQFSAASCWD